MAKKYKQQADGWYSTLVWDGTYNPDGSKHRKQIRSNKSSKDLEIKVRNFRDDVEKRKITVHSSITFLEYARQWRSVYKANCELNTRFMYDNIIDKHFNMLEGIKISDIKRFHLQCVLNECSIATGRQAYMTFKQIIRSAINDRLLPAIFLEDIFYDIKMPKPEKTEKRVLTEDEKKAIKAASFAPMDGAFLYLIYGCGLRREEALALTKFDIDLKHNILSINKALVFDGNNPCLKGTKSSNGVRSVPIPAFLSAYLKQYTKDLSGPNLFYTSGKPSMTKSSYDKMWARIVREINRAAGGTDSLKKIHGLTAHVFRHNYCSNLCYQVPTVSIKRIAQLLGDTEKVVMDVYNHIITEKEDTQKAVESAVGFI